MPIFVYYCDNCNEEKEMIHAFSEDPEILCSCSSKMKRAIQAGSFFFGGDGAPGQNLREKRNRVKYNEYIDKKQKDHGGRHRVKTVRESMQE